jgi:ADP-ribosylglycohydrolase
VVILKSELLITHAHPWSVAACYIYLEYLRKLLGGMAGLAYGIKAIPTV